MDGEFAIEHEDLTSVNNTILNTILKTCEGRSVLLWQRT